MLLLHGFPEFWWTWRHQLVTLAEAGYRAVAVDLRGYGGSDKPPRGYDLITAAADAAGLIRALGEANAIVVGHDWGGLTAWTLAAYFPKAVRRLAIVSMAHPLRMRARVLSSPFSVSRALSERPARRGAAATRSPSRYRCCRSGSSSATAARSWARSCPPGPHPAGPTGRPRRSTRTPCASRRWRTPRLSTSAGSSAPPSGPTACGTPARCGRRSRRRCCTCTARRPVHPAAGRPRRGPVRRGAVPLEGHRGGRPLPARGAARALRRRAARLARRPGAGPVTGTGAAGTGTPGRAGAQRAPAGRARPAAPQVRGGRTCRASPMTWWSPRPRRPSSAAGCSPTAGRSTPTRSSRPPGSPLQARTASCGAASPRSRWVSPTPAGATRAARPRCSAGAPATSPVRRPRQASVDAAFVAARADGPRARIERDGLAAVAEADLRLRSARPAGVSPFSRSPWVEIVDGLARRPRSRRPRPRTRSARTRYPACPPRRRTPRRTRLPDGLSSGPPELPGWTTALIS